MNEYISINWPAFGSWGNWPCSAATRPNSRYGNGASRSLLWEYARVGTPPDTPSIFILRWIFGAWLPTASWANFWYLTPTVLPDSMAQEKTGYRLSTLPLNSFNYGPKWRKIILWIREISRTDRALRALPSTLLTLHNFTIIAAPLRYSSPIIQKISRYICTIPPRWGCPP